MSDAVELYGKHRITVCTNITRRHRALPPLPQLFGYAVALTWCIRHRRAGNRGPLETSPL
ncbi:hypothetical protein BST29_00940 [Mycobacterium malmoense]|uniref:Uncharacterized protein n=1 Tax=Mycobacterium malmoense TaxID=1780 RepID=A0ABX3SXR9_MYCMA|nr:hypothetical protein BST29_00940 [Mycobacterium malmoense]